MSLPWSEKDLKATPVDDDEVMLIDSEDTNPETINKRAKLVTLPSSGQINTSSNQGTGVDLALAKVGSDLPFRTLVDDTNKIDLTQNAEDIKFTLGSLVVTTDQANTYADGFKQSFVADADNAGININTFVPSTLVPGDIWRSATTLFYQDTTVATQTIATLDLAQILINKTINANNNTISNLALGAEVTGASTDLTDSSNIARLDFLNDFTAGTASLFFRSESGSPADTGIVRLARIDDIAWRNEANDGNLLLEVDANEFLTFASDFIAVTPTQGNSGEVLTSNGVGTKPTFEDVTDQVFPVADNVMIIKGNASSTSQLRFEVDAIPAGQTRVITPPPNTDITLVETSDGTISNANVNVSAAIDFSKLATLSSANILLGNGSGVATSVAVSGDITITNTGVTSITSDVIINADVNSLAAIDFSKLATLLSANILVGDGSNVAASVAMTGDIAITNAGLTSISAGVILNADINSLAAIDFSKLESLVSANILVGDVSNIAASVAVTGDVNIDNAGLVTAQPSIIIDKAEKITPVGADQVLISDSGAGDALKRIAISSAVGVVPQGVFMANYRTTVAADANYWAVTGVAIDDSAFLERASPVPDNLTLSRLTVNVSVNSNLVDDNVNFDLVIGPTPILGSNQAVILGGQTGSFTDVTNSDILTSGVNIAYQTNDDALGVASNVTLIGASCIVRGT